MHDTPTHLACSYGNGSLSHLSPLHSICDMPRGCQSFGRVPALDPQLVEVEHHPQTLHGRMVDGQVPVRLVLGHGTPRLLVVHVILASVLLVHHTVLVVVVVVGVVPLFLVDLKQ